MLLSSFYQLKMTDYSKKIATLYAVHNTLGRMFRLFTKNLPTPIFNKKNL